MLPSIRFPLIIMIAVSCSSALATEPLGPDGAKLPVASLQIQPAEIALSGPRAAQQLIVTANADAATIHDLTDAAEYRTDDTAVAVVEGGIVRAVGNGTTILHLPGGGVVAG